LSLDDPVSRYIPELERLRFPTADTAPLRVRQLLTHGAGLPEDNPWGDRQLAISNEVLTRWLQTGLPFSTPPDTAYEYSNYGFALAGRVVATASGMPYEEYLAKEILAPLGMRASTLEPRAVPAAVRAIGYRKSGAGITDEPSLSHGAFGAMGGLLTSARDLARYVAYQLGAFPPSDARETGPVRRSSRREMQRLWRSGTFSVSASPLRVTAGGYGYGLAVTQDCRFHHIVGHGGGLPGFGSYMMWLPDYGVGIFAMANLTYAGPRGAIDEAFDALRKKGGLIPRTLPPSPALLSTRDAIVRLWQQWNDHAAAELAADNLFLDTPATERRSEMENLKSQVGVCRAPAGFEVENLLRGSFKMPCERGEVNVTFTLAPTMPPKVQFLRFVIAKPDDRSAEPACQPR
jgi:CubicO group peptidase (beta-lactamase class C family)